MAMVEQSKKDTMNAADFAEEFKTTPGRTPRIPETPEMPWTRPTRNADFFPRVLLLLVLLFRRRRYTTTTTARSVLLFIIFVSFFFFYPHDFYFQKPSLFPPPPPPRPASLATRAPLVHAVPSSSAFFVLLRTRRDHFRPRRRINLKIISSPKCAISSPSPSASESLTCSLSTFSRSRNFLAPLAAANAMAIIVNPTILSPTSPIAFMFNSFSARKTRRRVKITRTSGQTPTRRPGGSCLFVVGFFFCWPPKAVLGQFVSLYR